MDFLYVFELWFRLDGDLESSSPVAVLNSLGVKWKFNSSAEVKQWLQGQPKHRQYQVVVL